MYYQQVCVNLKIVHLYYRIPKIDHFAYKQKLAGYKVPLPESQGEDDDAELREQERQEEQERIDNGNYFDIHLL